MEFLIKVDIFLNIFPRTGYLLSRQIKKKFIKQVDFFLIIE